MNVSLEHAATLLTKYDRRLALAPSLVPNYIKMDSCRDASLNPVYFIYEEQDEFYYHAFHLAAVPESNFYDIQSPYGYGGPVATTNNQEFLAHAWSEYQSYCQSQNILAEFIRFHPLLENWQYYGGEVLFNRQTVWIDLNVDNLIASYQENRVRTAVRKGIKNNVAVQFINHIDFLPVFKKLYHTAMKRLNTSAFYFFNDNYIENLCTLETACLSVAIYNNVAVAALISLIKSGILELHLLGSSLDSNRLCATNLIYHETFIAAKNQGCHTVHFGGGASSAMDDPVLFFKLGFSNKTASYKIGKYIHKHDEYAHLARDYTSKTGKAVSRVLFYRD